MTSQLFAAQEMTDNLVKILAVVGGAAIGGLGLGFIVQLIVRGWTGQQVPRWAMMTLRVVAGVAAGWLVWFLVFTGGGPGRGPGPGGWFGTGTGDNKPAETKDKEPRKDDDSTRNVNTLEVEVLGEKTLREIDPKHWNPQRRYRLRTGDETSLLRREEVIDYLKKRLPQEPAVKMLIIRLYKDGPAPGTDWVEKLRDEAEVLTTPDGKRLDVSVPAAQEDAPLK
jgi:hypothetical protein